jgi:predicted DCC family thiol-disulfide oxidoreductase YuxK
VGFTNQNEKVAVLYDGLCRVCSWEIEKYRAQDTGKRLAFIDIEASGFDAHHYGLDAAQVRRVMHVISPTKGVITGADAFREIWLALERPGFLALAKISQLPLISSAFELGYQAFVRVRPWLPRKTKCDDGTCQIEGFASHSKP